MKDVRFDESCITSEAVVMKVQIFLRLNNSLRESEVRKMTINKTQRLSFHSFTRKAGQIIWVTLVIVVACLVILVGVLMILSLGKPEPFVDDTGKPLPGSLSEKVFVNINGVRQGMFIMSKDTSNPVLLYLHGGMPDFFLTKKYPTGLEDLFTVVWWEQRGSGMSYSPNIPRETMTMEQLVSDTLAVTNYLRERFGKDKIYVMGHSGGTFIGIQAAAQAPELYYAYLGEVQMSFQLKSEHWPTSICCKSLKLTETLEWCKNSRQSPSR